MPLRFCFIMLVMKSGFDIICSWADLASDFLLKKPVSCATAAPRLSPSIIRDSFPQSGSHTTIVSSLPHDDLGHSLSHSQEADDVGLLSHYPRSARAAPAVPFSTTVAPAVPYSTKSCCTRVALARPYSTRAAPSNVLLNRRHTQVSLSLPRDRTQRTRLTGQGTRGTEIIRVSRKHPSIREQIKGSSTCSPVFLDKLFSNLWIWGIRSKNNGTMGKSRSWMKGMHPGIEVLLALSEARLGNETEVCSQGVRPRETVLLSDLLQICWRGTAARHEVLQRLPDR